MKRIRKGIKRRYLIRIKKGGFTLVELIVVVAALGFLAGRMFFLLNPKKQLNKTFDAQRAQDLSTIQASLDTYYYDHNCYPQSVPFGTSWMDGNTTIAAKVPQDPQVTTTGGYAYITDTTSPCPSWNVVFNKLSNTSQINTCSLPADCRPTDWTDQWSCKVSGTPKCSSIISQSLTQNQEIAQNQPTVSNTTNPTPTGASNGSSNTISMANVTTNNSSNSNTTSNTNNKVTICHDTGNGTYNQIVTDKSSDVGGHDGHTNDIISPFNYSCFLIGTCSYAGKNWSSENQDIYNHACVTPAESSQCMAQYPHPTFQKVNYCTIDTRSILQNYMNELPTGKDGMMAHFYADYATFDMTNPSFADQPNIYWPYYWIDVSIHPDFSGKTCDTSVCLRLNGWANLAVNSDCETVLNYGLGDWDRNDTLINGKPTKLMVGFHTVRNYPNPYFLRLREDSEYWAYYRPGQKIYWRYRSTYPEDHGKFFTSSAIVNACVPSTRDGWGNKDIINFYQQDPVVNLPPYYLGYGHILDAIGLAGQYGEWEQYFY